MLLSKLHGLGGGAGLLSPSRINASDAGLLHGLLPADSQDTWSLCTPSCCLAPSVYPFDMSPFSISVGHVLESAHDQVRG